VNQHSLPPISVPRDTGPLNLPEKGLGERGRMRYFGRNIILSRGAPASGTLPNVQPGVGNSVSGSRSGEKG